MKLRRSCLSDAVIVHAGLNHFDIKPGDQVDLDQLVNGSTTLEAALGPVLAAKFEQSPSLADPVVVEAPAAEAESLKAPGKKPK